MKPMDRRVRKTRASIEQAMIELLNEQSMEDITVQAIADRADIHRGTFYKHYYDKFDIVEQWESDIFGAIQQIATRDDLPQLIVEGMVTRVPPEPLIDILRLLDVRRNVVRLLFVAGGDHSFEQKLRDVVIDAFEQNVQKVIDESELNVPFDYFREYVVAAHFGILRYWLVSEEKERLAPEVVAYMLSKMAFEGPMQASAVRDQVIARFDGTSHV